jgi:hypothetical protein
VIRGKLTGTDEPATGDTIGRPTTGDTVNERAKVGGKGVSAAPAAGSSPDAAGRVATGARAAPRAPDSGVGAQAAAASKSAGSGAAAGAPGGAAAEARWSGATGVDLTLQELANACGLSIARVQELERYGLIAGRAMAGTVYYDEEAMLIANLAAAFLSYGVEARHLRLYKNAAEREAGFIEQVVTPLLKQRNPRSRQQAMETIGELTRLGQDLRAALLRHALHGLTGP